MTENDWALWKTGLDGKCLISGGVVGEEICKGGGKGLFLPLMSPSENEWPLMMRQVLYVIGLGWMFMGVAIVADIFMGAIEEVTSKKVTKYDPVTGRNRSVKVGVLSSEMFLQNKGQV